MSKSNPLDHVLLLLVSKHGYSFERNNLISLRGSILSKVPSLECCEQTFINGKCLHRARADTHYSNMDSESNHLSSQKSHKMFGALYMEFLGTSIFFSVLAYCLHRTSRFLATL